MGNVTYKKFLDNFSSFGANLHPIFGTDPSPHHHSAKILHSLFCMSIDCTWDEEEETLSAPWAGEDHLYWASVAEKLEEAGIPLQIAASHQEEVLALAGITLA